MTPATDALWGLLSAETYNFEATAEFAWLAKIKIEARMEVLQEALAAVQEAEQDYESELEDFLA